jgi:hypothetical protein
MAAALAFAHHQIKRNKLLLPSGEKVGMRGLDGRKTIASAVHPHPTLSLEGEGIINA